MPCCGCGIGATFEQQFDAKRAARDTARYRKNGADPTTRLLRGTLAAQGRIEGSLLDVGCGIGALTFELLNLGINRAWRFFERGRSTSNREHCRPGSRDLLLSRIRADAYGGCPACGTLPGAFVSKR